MILPPMITVLGGRVVLSTGGVGGLTGGLTGGVVMDVQTPLILR